jgi:predicted kinase
MTKMILMVGLPASGKSYYAEAIAQIENAVIYSSDKLRIELFGDINNQEDNNKVFQELHKRIKEDLVNGNNVVYDATNINYKKRRAFLEYLNIDCEKICFLVATPYEKCLEQNRLRERKVPEYVIERMYKNFYTPQIYEGFDSIKIIWNTDGYIIDTNELFNGENGLNKIDQENKYHTLTIGKHCHKCFQLCEQLIDDFELNMAALYHDTGKRFCKAFVNGKGEVTENATYYQHHLVSAYDSLFIFGQQDYEKDTILKIANYIQWHMKPFFLESDKAKNKFINLVGEDCYNKLMILHEADMGAK